MASTKRVAELKGIVDRDPTAASIAHMWDDYNHQRSDKLREWDELRNFLFATDTSKTTNSTLPWKNKTTLPKLTQIRDNLHANYISTLFPKDDWVKWEADTQRDATKEKADIIESYVTNKIENSQARSVFSQLVYDYIDYGNAFSDVEYVEEKIQDPETLREITNYIGPRVVRISPYDIVFNPLAQSFKDSFNITRSVKTIGDLEKEVKTMPDNEIDEEMLQKIKDTRKGVHKGHYTHDDFHKALGFSVDGFGSLHEYFNSGLVEVLVFEGDFFDPEKGELYESQQITVVDRSHIIRRRQIPTWFGKTTKNHVAWRLRPDNLWGMGPLDNLVGMQYRIDHLENLKADVFDLIAHPPLKVFGQVEDFDWGPNEEINIADTNSDVQMLNPDTTALNADTQIQLLEDKMEAFAGAPRQAMGIRTPGEKTAFEVQALQQAASRIFQEKTRSFETLLVEPTLNQFLEIGRRNLNTTDVLRIVDDEFGVVQFMDVTREDITAQGKIRPVGARHFAEDSNLVQTLTELANSNMFTAIQNHVSGKRLAFLLERILNLEKHDIIQENVALEESAETQRLLQSLKEDMAAEAATPAEDEDVEGGSNVTAQELEQFTQQGSGEGR